MTDSLFLIDKKNEYILFMLEPGYSEFTPPNKRIEKVMVTCPWYSWSEQRQMPKILLRHKLDLVQTRDRSGNAPIHRGTTVTPHDPEDERLLRRLPLDGFAGPGRYLGGEEGSPLIALRALLQHPQMQAPRAGFEVRFFFIEERPDRATAL